MRLLLIVFIIVLPWDVFGRNFLFRGTGAVSSHGGILPFGPTYGFVAHVVFDFPRHGEMPSRFGYKLEFSDGQEEVLSLALRDEGTVELLNNKGDRYPTRVLTTAGSWSSVSNDDPIALEIKFGDREKGPTLEMSIEITETDTLLPNDLEIPDAKLTISAISAPSKTTRDIPIEELGISAVLDLNSLRAEDDSAFQLAKELW